MTHNKARFAKAAGLGLDEFRHIEPANVWAYRGGDRRHPHPGGDQGIARDLLAEVIAYDTLPASRQAELRTMLGRKVTAKMHVKAALKVKAGRPQLDLVPLWDGVEAIIYYVAAVLITEPQLCWRVGRCAYAKCGKFFFDVRVQGGRKKDYCSADHSNQDRVRRWRGRQKQEAKS
jgi:hypothetical protein